MFQLSVVDHIRLSFGDVIRGYKVHNAAAEQLAHRAWLIRTFILTLLGLGVIMSATLLVSDTRLLRMASPVFVSAGFLLYAASLVFDLGPRIQAHRSTATRFWLLCEKYRALLTEIQDGLIDMPQVRERRDALIADVHAVMERSGELGAIARSPSTIDSLATADAEVDAFMPSARKGTPTAA